MHILTAVMYDRNSRVLVKTFRIGCYNEAHLRARQLAHLGWLVSVIQE